MFGREKPQWLRAADYLINLGNVDYFTYRDADTVNVFFHGVATPAPLRGITIGDIYCYLKCGKPGRKAKK